MFTFQILQIVTISDLVLFQQRIHNTSVTSTTFLEYLKMSYFTSLSAQNIDFCDCDVTFTFEIFSNVFIFDLVLFWRRVAVHLLPAERVICESREV